MKLKAASEKYTQAMTDHGVATTLGLQQTVETGFDRLEDIMQNSSQSAAGTLCACPPLT